jgi:hypothetical protein
MDEIAAAKEAKNHAFELYNVQYSSTLERLACTTPRDFFQWINALSNVIPVDTEDEHAKSNAPTFACAHAYIYTYNLNKYPDECLSQHTYVQAHRVGTGEVLAYLTYVPQRHQVS